MKRLNDDQRELAESCVDMINATSNAMRRESPDRDAMLSAAAMGLVKAASTYDRAKGAAFRTHAMRRMQCAILDIYRNRGSCLIHSPRSVKSDDRVRVISLDSRSLHGWEESHAAFVTTDGPDLLGDVDGEGLWRLAGLFNPWGRDFLVAYYRDGQSMKQIGVRFGFSESRVSQVISETLSLMRQELLTRDPGLYGRLA